MPFYQTPGVYIVEQPGRRTIQPIGTGTAAFVAPAPDPGAHLNEATPVNNWSDFRTKFAPSDDLPGLSTNYLFHAVNGFFQNGGSRLYVVNTGANGSVANGLRLLEANDEISILAAPGFTDISSHEAATAFCEKRRDVVCILDPPNIDNPELLKIVETAPVAGKPARGKDKDAAAGTGDKPAAGAALGGGDKPPEGGALTRSSEYSTVYFPWLVVPDPVNPTRPNPDPTLPPIPNFVEIPPSGHMAGVWSRVDAQRGVHKAPANEPVAGATGLKYLVTAEEQGPLNSLGVNCIRTFARIGPLICG